MILVVLAGLAVGAVFFNLLLPMVVTMLLSIVSIVFPLFIIIPLVFVLSILPALLVLLIPLVIGFLIAVFVVPSDYSGLTSTVVDGCWHVTGTWVQLHYCWEDVSYVWIMVTLGLSFIAFRWW
jgi:hypothetical protein